MLVAEEDLGDAQGVVELAAADEVLRGEHGDAALPQRLRARQAVEQRAVAVAEIGADDVGRGDVDQIPVINTFRTI